MMRLHWIRFDIPYDDNATVMRAAAGIMNGTEMEVRHFNDQKDIPGSLSLILDTAERERIEVSEDLCLVAPLDERMNLAWVVKDLADQRKYQYSRHIPEKYDPGIEDELPFAGSTTGGIDDQLANDQAAGRAKGINLEALDHYKSGYMLEAITLLRRALHLTLRYTGWTSEISLYTLRNLLFSLAGTGSPDNERHALALIRRLVRTVENNPALKPSQASLKSYLNDIAETARRCNDPGLTGIIKQW